MYSSPAILSSDRCRSCCRMKSLRRRFCDDGIYAIDACGEYVPTDNLRYLEYMANKEEKKHDEA